jgi:hypothetical protein
MSGRSEGTVSCGSYRAQFAVSELGSVQIAWPTSKPTGDMRTVQRVAREVVENALLRRPA